MKINKIQINCIHGRMVNRFNRVHMADTIDCPPMQMKADCNSTQTKVATVAAEKKIGQTMYNSNSCSTINRSPVYNKIANNCIDSFPTKNLNNSRNERRVFPLRVFFYARGCRSVVVSSDWIVRYPGYLEYNWNCALFRKQSGKNTFVHFMNGNAGTWHGKQ